jgi:hypothetical protein
MSLRTPLENYKYKRHLRKYGSTPLCDLPAIREWTYWKLVAPISKYNRHHTDHLMLTMKRPCDNFYEKATNNEIYELIRVVLPELKKDWHYLKINFDQMISVPDYVHFHVLKLKKRYQ